MTNNNMTLRELLKDAELDDKRNPLYYLIESMEELNINEDYILDFLNKFPIYPINKKIAYNGTPILSAARNEHYKVVDKLIDMGADLNQYEDFGNGYGLIELLILAETPNMELIKKILINNKKIHKNVVNNYFLINNILNQPDWKEYIDILIKNDNLHLDFSIYTYYDIKKVIDYLVEIGNYNQVKKWIKKLKYKKENMEFTTIPKCRLLDFQDILKKEEEYKNLDIDNGDYYLVLQIYKSDLIDTINDIINDYDKRIKNKFEKQFENKLDEKKISHIIFDYM
jgi:hypothetical protein